MKQEWYKLANSIDSSAEAANEKQMQLNPSITRNYKQEVLGAIRQKRRIKNKRRMVAVAACLAVMTATTAVFQNEVQAAIEQIRYSLSAALGKDMSSYSEVVHTSVSNAGYTITLEEVVAAEEELIVSYMIQSENGDKTVPENTITGKLSVNGKQAALSAGSSGGYLDRERKQYGCQVSYQIPDVDFSGKNKFELEFTDHEQVLKGNWKIQFEASGSELFLKTKEMEVGVSYTLPDKNRLILDALSFNDLAQRVTFHTTKKGLKQDIELRAQDDQGTTIRFSMTEMGNGKGVFENSFVIEDGAPVRNWVAKDAKTLTLTVYISGQFHTEGEDVWQQVGDALTLDLTKLKNKKTT